jgi:hypothetical protein
MECSKKMKPQTTIRIFKDQLAWVKKCCKIKNMSTCEFIEEIERQCKLHHQRETYNKLPMPSNFKMIKPLSNTKIKRYRICIQEGIAT